MGSPAGEANTSNISGGINLNSQQATIGGDLVGRDQITQTQGDEVKGNKIVNNYYEPDLRHTLDVRQNPDPHIERRVAALFGLLTVWLGIPILWLVILVANHEEIPQSTGSATSNTMLNLSQLEIFGGGIALIWIALWAIVLRPWRWQLSHLVQQLVKGEEPSSPFYVIHEEERLTEYLLPTIKNTSLTDQSVPYVDRGRQDLRKAVKHGARILIHGRSKCGKTRECVEVLKEKWYLGFTVLVPKPGTLLSEITPAAISSLPTHGLMLVLDDVHRYFSKGGKEIAGCIQILEHHCGDANEVSVVCMARDERVYWPKLQVGSTTSAWKDWLVFRLSDVTTEEGARCIRQIAGQLRLSISDNLIEAMAHKNDGTFLNIVLTFRDWARRNIQSVSQEEIREFQGELSATWKQKWDSLRLKDRYVETIGSAILTLYSQDLPTTKSMITTVALWQRLSKWQIALYFGWQHYKNRFIIWITNWLKSMPNSWRLGLGVVLCLLVAGCLAAIVQVSALFLLALVLGAIYVLILVVLILIIFRRWHRLFSVGSFCRD
jgi:hypothetical protein